MQRWSERRREERGERKNNLQVVLIAASVLERVADYFVLGQRSPRTTCQRWLRAFSGIVKSTIEFYFQSEIPDSQKAASTLFRSIKIKGEGNLLPLAPSDVYNERLSSQYCLTQGGIREEYRSKYRAGIFTVF